VIDEKRYTAFDRKWFAVPSVAPVCAPTVGAVLSTPKRLLAAVAAAGLFVVAGRGAPPSIVIAHPDRQKN